MTDLADHSTILEYHESTCTTVRGQQVCSCRPLRRKKPKDEWVVLDLPGYGRFVWEPILSVLYYHEPGQRKATENWPVNVNEASVEGVRKVAVRRARELVYEFKG